MAYDRSTFGTEFSTVDQEFIIEDFKQTVTYQRGASTVSIDAIPGDVVVTYDQSTGLDIALGDASFWLKLDQLDFDGGAGVFKPRKGDKITTANSVTFEVLAPGTIDAERILVQVPVIQVEYTQNTRAS